MAWWDAFSNSGYGYEPEPTLEASEEYIAIFGPRPAVIPGEASNIYVTGAANRWDRRLENFSGIVEDFDLDELLQEILSSLPLKGNKTKDTWLEVSDPRNYDIHEPVLYEMKDGAQFLAFLDTLNNVPMNRVYLKSFKRSPSSKIIYQQVKTIRAGFFVPNVHPGLRTPGVLELNAELNPLKDIVEG